MSPFPALAAPQNPTAKSLTSLHTRRNPSRALMNMQQCAMRHPPLSTLYPWIISSYWTPRATYTPKIQSSSCIVSPHHAHRTRNSPCTSSMLVHLYVIVGPVLLLSARLLLKWGGLLDATCPDDVWTIRHSRADRAWVWVWALDGCHFLNWEQSESAYFVIRLNSVVVYLSLICLTAY